MKNKSTRDKILLVIAAIIALVAFRFFLLWFLHLFDNVKRHGINPPGYVEKHKPHTERVPAR